MRRLVISLLAATVLVGLSGCGDAGPGRAGKPSSTAPATPTTSPDAKALLRDAQDALVDAGHGSYRATVNADFLGDGPFIDDRAEYDLESKSFRLERMFTNPEPKAGEPNTLAASFVQIGGRRMFMQMPGWKTAWHGCWLEFRPADLEKLTTLDLALDSGLPAVVAAILVAEVVAEQPETETVAATVPGSSGLQLLGLNPAKLEQLGYDVDQEAGEVPITIRVVNGRITQVTVSGSEVGEALRQAGKTTKAGTIANALSATIDFSTARPGPFKAPAAALLLPRQAKPADTCPANR